MSTDHDDLDGEDSAKPGRQEQKLEAEAFAELARSLAKGSPAVLPDPPFDEELRQAVLDARGLAKSARSRQIRRLARLLLEAAEIEVFRAALEGRSPEMLADRAEEQRNEAWRKRLLEQGDPALDELLAQHPGLDRAQLRQLMRSARKDPPDARSKSAATRLLRLIREGRAGAGAGPE